jgi:hypothetical protein
MGQSPDNRLGGFYPSFPEESELHDFSIDPPDLPYKEMLILLEMMGQYQWKIPLSLGELPPENQSSFINQEPKEVVEKWKEFCVSILQGGQAMRPDLFEEEKIESEHQDIQHWKLLAEIVIKDPQKTKELVEGAYNALDLLEKGKKIEVTGQLTWDIDGAKRLIRSVANYYGRWMVVPESIKNQNLHSNS